MQYSLYAGLRQLEARWDQIENEEKAKDELLYMGIDKIKAEAFANLWWKATHKSEIKS